MSKVVVRKDHGLWITLKQRQQKFSELLCMIPRGWGEGQCEGGGEGRMRQYFPYMLG